jgi:hypothetical protein
VKLYVGVSSIEGGKWRMMRWVRVKEDYRIRGVKSSVFAARERERERERSLKI